MKRVWLHKWLALDAVWTERVSRIARSILGRFTATIFAHSGDSLLWLIAGVILWRFGLGLWAQIGERIVIVTALTWLCTTVLKVLFRRPRPEGEQGLFYLDIDANSFPSGHAARVCGLAVALGLLLPGWTALLLAVWAVCVCSSRVALELHYLGDVVVGAILGAGAGLLLINW
ncbi:MAG: phosphatase PAP2 family protein [Anaerolineae bacterium]|nr:phosphatase PAP2 family protein [Anaerolineae bacterium]